MNHRKNIVHPKVLRKNNIYQYVKGNNSNFSASYSLIVYADNFQLLKSDVPKENYVPSAKKTSSKLLKKGTDLRLTYRSKRTVEPAVAANAGNGVCTRFRRVHRQAVA